MQLQRPHSAPAHHAVEEAHRQTARNALKEIQRQLKTKPRGQPGAFGLPGQCHHHFLDKRKAPSAASARPDARERIHHNKLGVAAAAKPESCRTQRRKLGLSRWMVSAGMLRAHKTNIRQPAGAGGTALAPYQAISWPRLHPRTPRPLPIGPLLPFYNCVLQVQRRQSRSSLSLLRRPR